jgi:nitroreductase
MFPKIELHVHLEGTVRAGALLRIARRNDVPLPADSVEGLAELYRFRDFAHFLEAWLVTTRALRTEQDFRQVVVDYAAAMSLGVSARDCYLAGVRGALCDEQTKDRLRQVGERFDWAGLTAPGPA